MLCPKLAAVLNTPRHFNKGFAVVVVVIVVKSKFSECLYFQL